MAENFMISIAYLTPSPSWLNNYILQSVRIGLKRALTSNKEGRYLL